MPTVSKKHIKSKDGTNLYYETYLVENSTATIFLIHGVGGDIDAWQYVRDNLIVAEISCVAMDIRGHGYSGHPRSFKSYAIENYVEDFITVLNAEKLDKVILVGHSLGAITSTHIALNHPERLEKLVLISSSYIPPPYLHIPVLKQIITALINILAFISPPAMRPWHSTYPAGKHHKDFEIYGLIRTIAHNSLRSYLLASNETLRHELKSRLASIKMPTLLISGDKDSVFPTKNSQFIHSQIEGSILKIIPGGNHVLPLNNIKEISNLIIDFVA
jgi:pimeloyl-ACP methyl ester carboxylesterase